VATATISEYEIFSNIIAHREIQLVVQIASADAVKLFA